MISEMSVRCFLSLAETLSFTETARRNYMSQQAVSRTIAKLEDDLGVPLFIRNHHYVVLTRAGEEFYQFFRSYQEEYQETLERTRKYYAERYRSIYIGCLDWFDLSASIHRAMEVLQAEQPGLQFHLEKFQPQQMNALFQSHSLDLILSYGSSLPRVDGMRKQTILELPLVLVVPPGHPRNRPGAVVEDFRTEPFIWAAGPESQASGRIQARHKCRELGLSPSEILVVPDMQAVFQAVEQGRGVAMTTLLSCRSLKTDLPWVSLGQNEQVVCLWYMDQQNPAVPAFADTLITEVQEEMEKADADHTIRQTMVLGRKRRWKEEGKQAPGPGKLPPRQKAAGEQAPEEGASGAPDSEKTDRSSPGD